MLPRRRVPVREARRDKSTILLRNDERGRSGLGALPLSSDTKSSSSSNNIDRREGEVARGGTGNVGGARVDTNSSLSEVNLAMTSSNVFELVSLSKEDSEVAVITGIKGLSVEEEEVGRKLSLTALVLCCVLMALVCIVGGPDSSSIVS